MRKILLAVAVALMLTSPIHAKPLMVYTSQAEEMAQKTIDAFQKANPGIEVEWIRNGTSAMMNVLRAEIEAGGIIADVVLLADIVNFSVLKQGGHLLAYPEAPVADYDSAYYDKDMMYFGTRALTTGIMYNTDNAKPVSSYMDLLVEENRGMIAVPSPLYSGAALNHLHAMLGDPDGPGWAFYEGLEALDIVPAGGNGGAKKAVATGLAKYGIVVDEVAISIKLTGSPVDYIIPTEGVSYITEPVAIIATSKKVDEAKAFVDWVLSVDAQKFMMSEGKIPLHPDASPPEGYPNVNEIKLLSFNAEEALKNNDAIRAKFADMFGL